MNKQKIVEIVNDNYTQMKDQFGVENIEIRSWNSKKKVDKFG